MRWTGRLRGGLAPLLAVAAGGLAACGSSGPATPPAPSIGSAGAAEVYVDVGASDALGVGIPDDALRLRDSWPQLFFNSTLPRASTYYNLGIGGETVRAALAEEVPQALSLHPTVVSVWFNVDDLARGVSAKAYENDLGTLVHALRQGGRATVLIANTPVLDRLPAYLACRGQEPGVTCLLGQGVTPPEPAVLDALVDQYNGAIARVAAREGAVPIDLHAQGEVPDLHPDWVGTDGFHPSAQGYAQVAHLFAQAFTRARSKPV